MGSDDDLELHRKELSRPDGSSCIAWVLRKRNCAGVSVLETPSTHIHSDIMPD